MTVKMFRHQEAFLRSFTEHPEIPFVFLIGGFGCGKSFSAVQLILLLYHAYHDHPEPICFGILGVTIKLLKQTVIADVERFFDRYGIKYRDNMQAGTITCGSITFVYLPMQNPDDIYAFNFHGAICDEIDEVPSDRVKSIVTAIQERCRKILPAGHNFPSREPFIAFTTTAQGLGGTYRLIKYFQENDIPYIKVRGRTRDNTTLAPQQLKMLTALYTEDEQRAYLDGEFVNLATGRVYGKFNEKRHIYMPFDLKDDDVIYCGQDFNYLFNACVEMVERGGRIFVVNIHHWDFVGDAPRRLREIYGNRRILWIPDASGKEIMQGIGREISDFNIEVYWNNKNPSISERILAVNKLLGEDRLLVFNGLNKLQDCLATRDFDDSGKPRKGSGPDAVDHWGDALEYGVWRIVHTVNGYDKILEHIRARRSNFVASIQ